MPGRRERELLFFCSCCLSSPPSPPLCPQVIMAPHQFHLGGHGQAPHWVLQLGAVQSGGRAVHKKDQPENLCLSVSAALSLPATVVAFCFVRLWWDDVD